MKHTNIFLVLNVWLRSSVGCSIQSSSTRLWYESRPSLAFFRLLFCYCLNCSSLVRIFSALQEKNPPTSLFIKVGQNLNVLTPGQLHLIRSFGGTFRSTPGVNFLHSATFLLLFCSFKGDTNKGYVIIPQRSDSRNLRDDLIQLKKNHLLTQKKNLTTIERQTLQ